MNKTKKKMYQSLLLLFLRVKAFDKFKVNEDFHETEENWDIKIAVAIDVTFYIVFGHFLEYN